MDSGIFGIRYKLFCRKTSYRTRSQALMFRLIKSFQIILVNSYTS